MVRNPANDSPVLEAVPSFISAAVVRAGSTIHFDMSAVAPDDRRGVIGIPESQPGTHGVRNRLKLADTPGTAHRRRTVAKSH